MANKNKKQMKPLQAYEVTLEKIQGLRECGIQVKINPSEYRENKKLASDINRKINISADKWINVIFASLTIGQLEKINEVAGYLGMCGIQFGVSGYQGDREWNLDWSFKYTGKEDFKWAEARRELEGTINKLSK